MSGSFLAWLDSRRPEIESALASALPPESRRPERLHAAMRYSVFAGGKRLRPGLVLMVADILGAEEIPLLPAAAVECIHTYSLIHDDLPAMDDDDLRRGRPTLHRAFDEATAILAGDALLTLGLTLLATEPRTSAGELRSRATALVGGAIGTAGMIGGQAEDIAAERAWPADAAAVLERIHRGKTAALLTASLRLGGLYGGADAGTDARLAALGERLGLMFQIRDDILDVAGTARALGKTPGKDASSRKLTFPALHGVAASEAAIERNAGEARAIAKELRGSERFFALIEDLASRDH